MYSRALGSSWGTIGVDAPLASYPSPVLVDMLFDPFGGRWSDVHAGALAAEAAGVDGVWLNDHLAGSVQGESWVLESWTTLTAIAASVPRIAIGPLVLNVANRDPGVVAVMAATLQEVSGGRLLLGLGAGGGSGTPYAAEQEALGRRVLGAAERRDRVEDAVSRVREAWTGTVAGVSGFLRPDPPPPIVIAGLGPKMAELAGRVGDGIATRAGPDLPALIRTARDGCEASGRDPEEFMVMASSYPSRRESERLAELGVDRVIVSVPAPYVDGVAKACDALQ
jgi:alkanesulfonate monooxygenase SsuD/methylene tetrahydromethanopterin reductase-like flavin-dependent oxidoreductase (luciferase family)